MSKGKDKKLKGGYNAEQIHPSSRSNTDHRGAGVLEGLEPVRKRISV